MSGERLSGHPADGPLYAQLANRLRTAIYEGEIPPGQRLPTEQDLMERYAASRTTVRHALEALKAEGLIESARSRGTFVRERPIIRVLASSEDSQARQEERRRRGGRLDTFNTEIEAQGRVARQEIVEAVPEDPPDELAARLDLELGKRVLARRRLMYVDDEPIALADSYYPLDLVEDTAIARPEDAPEGVLTILAERGYAADHFVDELSFRMPTPDEARRLRLRTGVPVVRRIRVAYDGEGRPFEVYDSLLAGDKHILVYEVGSA